MESLSRALKREEKEAFEKGNVCTAAGGGEGAHLWTTTSGIKDDSSCPLHVRRATTSALSDLSWR